MSEDQHNNEPDSSAPDQSGAKKASKSFDELMKGFEEIRKIQTNQDVFDRKKALKGEKGKTSPEAKKYPVQ